MLLLLFHFIFHLSQTYLWLLSFRRQWRVTILWPSLLTSWLTVHTTGLLALAPRKATPSFSLTLKHKHTHIREKVKKFHKKLHKHNTLSYFTFSLSNTHKNMSKERHHMERCFRCLSQRSQTIPHGLSFTLKHARRTWNQSPQWSCTIANWKNEERLLEVARSWENHSISYKRLT